jgi:DNA-binding transcriptional ArsR family regulator
MAPEATKILRRVQEASAILHPLRIRLLANLIEPNSAVGLARRLGLPRQMVNYHLRELEEARLVEFMEERRRGNCSERIVRSVARSYLISPEALGELATDPEREHDRFSPSYLVALAARAIRELGVLLARAARAKKYLMTFCLHTEVRFANSSELRAFTDELTRLIDRLAAKYHAERSIDGRLIRVFCGAYPAITRTDANEAVPAGSTASELAGRT